MTVLGRTADKMHISAYIPVLAGPRFISTHGLLNWQSALGVTRFQADGRDQFSSFLTSEQDLHFPESLFFFLSV